MKIRNTLIASVVFEPEQTATSRRVQLLAHYFHHNFEDLLSILGHVMKRSKRRVIETTKFTKKFTNITLTNLESENVPNNQLLLHINDTIIQIRIYTVE